MTSEQLIRLWFNSEGYIIKAQNDLHTVILLLLGIFANKCCFYFNDMSIHDYVFYMFDVRLQCTCFHMYRILLTETYSNDHKGGNGVQTAPIGFTATITKAITYFNPSTCIVYDCIVTNIGNAYNHQSGMFTAPVHGIYNFFVKTMVEGDHTLNLDIVVNGARIVSVETYGHYGRYGSGSASAVTVLNPGDQVFIKSRTSHASHLWGNNWNTFSGYLVKAM